MFAIRPRFLLLVLFLSAATTWGHTAPVPADTADPYTSFTDDVVLYSHDELRSTYGFTTRSYGMVERDGVLYNRNSQIRFWIDEQGIDTWSVACQGGEQGTIVDLGDLRFQGPSQSSMYRAIAVHEGRVTLKGSFCVADPAWAGGVLPAPTPGLASAPIALGHIYVVAIAGISTPGLGVADGGTLYLKFRVVDHEPGRYARFVWEVLGTEDAPGDGAGPSKAQQIAQLAIARERAARVVTSRGHEGRQERPAPGPCSSLAAAESRLPDRGQRCRTGSPSPSTPSCPLPVRPSSYRECP